MNREIEKSYNLGRISAFKEMRDIAERKGNFFKDQHEEHYKGLMEAYEDIVVIAEAKMKEGKK